MTSQSPYTFSDVEDQAQIVHRDPLEVAWLPRPHTRVVLDGATASVYHYGSRIARLYSDDKVALLPSLDMSSTTRNRLNDVLMPLHYQLRKIDGRWFVVPRHGGSNIEYRPNLIVTKRCNCG